MIQKKYLVLLVTQKYLVMFNKNEKTENYEQNLNMKKSSLGH